MSEPIYRYGTLRKTKKRIRIRLKPSDISLGGKTKIGIVTDLDTGTKYRTSPKSCGLPNCKCELWLSPVS